MRRKHTDVVRGSRENSEIDSSTNATEFEGVTQAEFKKHRGTLQYEEDDDGSAGQGKGWGEERSWRADRRGDSVEIGIAGWIGRNIKSVLGAAFTLISLIVVAVFYGTFHVTQFQGAVETTRDDVKEIRGEVKKLGENAVRQSVRIDHIEKNHDRLERVIEQSRARSQR